jgi:hypothetical protein
MRSSLQSEPATNSKSRHPMKKFSDLTEREVLTVAIASEEEDGRIYMSFAENLAERYPESARLFEQMAEEEKSHRHMLLELYEQRFGSNLPPIRREDVKRFPASPPGRGSPWLRGATCGIMTTLGGLGHALPYLVPDNWSNAFWIATSLAGVVVSACATWTRRFCRRRSRSSSAASSCSVSAF